VSRSVSAAQAGAGRAGAWPSRFSRPLHTDEGGAVDHSSGCPHFDIYDPKTGEPRHSAAGAFAREKSPGWW